MTEQPDLWVTLEITPGPEPLTRGDDDPKFVRRPVGFAPPRPEHDPRLWDGDQA